MKACNKCGVENQATDKLCKSCRYPVGVGYAAPRRGAAGQTAPQGCAIALAFAILIGVPTLIVKGCDALQPSDQETQAKAARDAFNKEKGLHCLTGGDGSNPSFVEAVKATLREPSSFESAETRVGPKLNGKHFIYMQYRARNGFGGMNMAYAEGQMDNTTCETVLLRTEN